MGAVWWVKIWSETLINTCLFSYPVDNFEWAYHVYLDVLQVVTVRVLKQYLQAFQLMGKVAEGT